MERIYGEDVHAPFFLWNSDSGVAPSGAKCVQEPPSDVNHVPHGGG